MLLQYLEQERLVFHNFKLVYYMTSKQLDFLRRT